MMYLVQGEQLKTSAFKIQNRVADKQENQLLTIIKESMELKYSIFI